MSNYTQNVFFATKDTLTQGDPSKKIKGTEIDAEFAEISTAIASKADSASTITTGNFDTEADAWLAADTTMVGLLRDLADPGGDRIPFWDDSAGVLAWLQIDSSLAIVGQTLSALGTGGGGGSYTPQQTVDHTTVSVLAGSGLTGGGTIDGSVTLNVGAGSGIAVAADSVAIDLTGLTALAEPIASDDIGVLYDLSNTANRKVAYQDLALPVDTVAGTTKTLVAADMNRVQYCTAGTATTLTVNTGIGAVGQIVPIIQYGAGQVTVAGTATCNAATGKKTRAQYSVIILLCVAANTWVCYGDSAA